MHDWRSLLKRDGAEESPGKSDKLFCLYKQELAVPFEINL